MDIIYLPLHPQKLTWNLKRMVSERNLLLEGSMFRFHVSFLGSICLWSCVWWSNIKRITKNDTTANLKWFWHDLSRQFPHRSGKSVAGWYYGPIGIPDCIRIFDDFYMDNIAQKRLTTKQLVENGLWLYPWLPCPCLMLLKTISESMERHALPRTPAMNPRSINHGRAGNDNEDASPWQEGLATWISISNPVTKF